MYFKMALRNVRKSFKDYSIYFLTLTFGVCIFYCFNSITDQKAMTEIGAHQAIYVEMLKNILSGVSVFVSIILGSLILYGNSFLIKRRKKELGVYRILGMSNRKIAQMLFIETICVGVAALGVGLLLGVAVGQGLSVFTLKLFTMDISHYAFAASGVAMVKSILYFGIIFIIVMCFNALSLSKHKIIDLLYASKKNEVTKVKSSLVTVVGFILSILCLLSAYVAGKKAGINPEDPLFTGAIVLGVLGTYGYFKSLTGFLTGMLKKSKRIYFKELNIFTIGQISSKVHTHVISMTMICLMLFMTIGGLATGLSFKYTLERGLEETTPYDASLLSYLNEGENVVIEEVLASLGVHFEGSETYATYTLYKTDQRLGELEPKGIIPSKFQKMKVDMMSLSDFNAITSLEGKEAVELEENEVLLTSSQQELIESLRALIQQQPTLTLGGKDYNYKDKEVISFELASSGFASNFATLIVPDYIVADQAAFLVGMNIMYGEQEREASEVKFVELFEGYREGRYKGEKIDYDVTAFMNGSTREQIYRESQSMTTVILYVGIYLGIVFLISSAAILALQQLSEASDSIDRYDALRKIGASRKLIDKTIFIQTVIYFSVPLILALVHAVVGINIANDFLSMYGKPDIGASSMLTLGILVVVYGGYFYTTYTGYRNIVHHKIK
ncbi:MAG: FtsX-like permease family protein [Cellulosilyticaceae bacterium]